MWFLDYLFPKYLNCVICQRHLYEKEWFCNLCKSEFQIQTGYCCKYCGRMLLKGSYPVCNICKVLNRYFEGGTSVVVYDDPVKELIKAYKYKNKKYLAEVLSEYMHLRFMHVFGDIQLDGIVYVPTHEDKLKHKKWCPAEQLALQLGHRMDLEVKPVLKRTRNTPPLNAIPLDERYEILKGAFTSEKVDGRYLLVDDIITSGNTLNECAKVLKEKGASEIYILTFAASE
ncbi:MAG: ComF family protein [Clostridia bacterium]|nr:ComF family protein [Clostridia bacterium]